MKGVFQNVMGGTIKPLELEQLNQYLLNDCGYAEGHDADGFRDQVFAFSVNGLDCIYHPEALSVLYIDPVGQNAVSSVDEEDPAGPPGRCLFYAYTVNDAIQWASRDCASRHVSYMHYRAAVRLGLGRPLSEDDETAIDMFWGWQGVTVLQAIRELATERDKLILELRQWQSAHGYNHECAYEQMTTPGLPEAHYAYLNKFCERWATVEDEDRP
jgi:hypothetical protein